MTREELFKEIKRKKSFLCVGLDSDPKKIPAFLNKFDDFDEYIHAHEKATAKSHRPLTMRDPSLHFPHIFDL